MCRATFRSGEAAHCHVCAWKGDLVSESMLKPSPNRKYKGNGFTWERDLWKWTVQSFKALAAKHGPGTAKDLAFLDVGTNVGDWITPIRLALPGLPILGVEGSPATAQVAIANVASAAQFHEKKGRAVGPTKMLPFAMVEPGALGAVQQKGGVCFEDFVENIGGQGIETDAGKLQQQCPLKSLAGATTLGHALKGLAGAGAQGPKVYIMKLDIQNGELTALRTAQAWLRATPPCYVFLEMARGRDENKRTKEVLTFMHSFGYDAVWRTHDPYSEDLYEYPPSSPFWGAAGGGTLESLIAKTLEALPQAPWQNLDYIFGFADRAACVARLVKTGGGGLGALSVPAAPTHTPPDPTKAGAVAAAAAAVAGKAAAVEEISSGRAPAAPASGIVFARSKEVLGSTLKAFFDSVNQTTGWLDVGGAVNAEQMWKRGSAMQELPLQCAHPNPYPGVMLQTPCDTWPPASYLD